MKQPTHLDVSWKRIWQLNMRFVFASLSVFIGWLAWTNASPMWWGLWLIGGMMLAGGTMEFLATGYRAFELFGSHRKLQIYQDQGSDPKADSIASEDDILAAGDRK